MRKTLVLAALHAAAKVGTSGLLVIVAACSSDDPPSAETEGNADYYPLRVGDHRVYRRDMTLGDYGQQTTFPTRTITGTRDVDGKAYLIEHQIADGEVHDVLFRSTPTAIQSTENGGFPSWDLIRFPYTVGATFAQEQGPFDAPDRDGDGKPESLMARTTTTVKGLTTVTTPAGSFTRVLHVRADMEWSSVMSKTGTTRVDTATLETWFAPGVGPVRTRREAPDGYIEVWELLSRRTADQAPADRTAPTLLDVKLPTHIGEPLVFTFDEPVTASVLAAVSVTDKNGNLATMYRTAPWDHDGRTVAMSPYTWPGGLYTVRIAAGVTDIAGNTMATQADRSFSIDASRFTAYYGAPYSQTVNVPSYDPKLTMDFNDRIDPTTIAGVTLREGAAAVAATVSLANEHLLSVEPAAPLKPSTRYTIDLTGVQSLGGDPVVNPLDWTFTTGPTVAVRTTTPR